MAKVTRNSLIDASLSEGKLSTAQIVSEVLKQFPDADERAVKRQIYSRRFSLKSRPVTA